MFGNLSGGDLLIVVISIFISMSIHEAMHAFMAHWLGDTTAKDMGRLSLNPLKRVDLFTTILLPIVLLLLGLPPIFAAKPVPFNPNRVRYDEYGAALVGVAGPLTNFVLATLAALVIRLAGASFSFSVLDALGLFIAVNLGFFVFNMIPLPPLDGSRLLYAFAPTPVQEVMARIESMGFFPILILLVLLAPVIGPFISSIDLHLFNLLVG